MNEKLNKFIKQKTKIRKDFRKIYYITETNDDEINKNNEAIKTIKRPICNRKMKNKKYDDLSLRISEFKKFISHYENDLFVFKN